MYVFKNPKKTPKYPVRSPYSCFKGILDVPFFDGAGPQAVNGLSGRFTFTKLGSVIKLETGEELQLIIQDDLMQMTDFGVSIKVNIIINEE